jgi:hypothetical protein
MKTNKLILGIAFSVMTASAFAAPALTSSNVSQSARVAEGGTVHTNVGSVRLASDGADRVGSNRQASDGADRVGANRLAADGADRVGANRVG